MRIAGRVAGMLAGLSVLTGCFATATPPPVPEIDALKAQVAKLQEGEAALRTGLESLRAAGGPTGGGADGAALDARLASLETDLAAVRQNLEDTRARVETLSQDLLATRELALRAVPPRTAPSQPPEGDAEEPPAPNGESIPTGLEDPPGGGVPVEDTFNAAYVDYTRGDYPQAVSGFQEFLRRYPESDLADNAQYWIAESAFAQGDFETAAGRYQELIEKYPKADRLPAALLKRGLCLILLNRKPEGVVVLQHLIEAHPSSEEARLARVRLEEMGVKP